MYTEFSSFDMPQEPSVPAGFRQCTFCAAIAYPGDDYCASCGHALVCTGATRPPDSCPHCGAMIRDRIAFHCTQCGTSLRRHDRG